MLLFKIIFLKNILFRFVLVGILNAVVGYSLFALFIYFGLHYSMAVMFSTVLGVLFNFKSIGSLVFHSRNNQKIYKFIGVYVVIYLLNIVGLWIFSLFGVKNMYIAGLLLLPPLAIFSFLLNRKFVFFERVSHEKN
jgi:putative flippase GtrA